MVASTHSLPAIIAKLNARKNRLLLVLQACIGQQHQYDAMRKIVLDELGRDGFEKELEEVLQHMERNGQGRNIQAGEGVPK